MSTASGFSLGGRPAKCFNVHSHSPRLLFCCFVDIFGAKVFATHTFSLLCLSLFSDCAPPHDELVLIAATNQPARQLKRQWGLPLFLARQLRLHCRQLLRGSASHPTRGMLSTKNWAVSLRFATLSTSPRRTGKTRSQSQVLPLTSCPLAYWHSFTTI